MEDGVAWITLNRPRKRNAVSGALRSALAESVRQAERDAEVRVVVVTGAGNAFCAGADVGEFQGREGAVDEIRAEYERLLIGLRTMPKPTIAAVNGVAAGIGASVAMCCDLRYAVPEAYFKEAFVNIGLTVDGGASWLLPRIVGMSNALYMLLTGRFIDAHEAHRIGLVQEVVAHDQVLARARAVAEQICANAPMAVRMTKELALRSRDMSLADGVRYYQALQKTIEASEDLVEGTSAFEAKRTPRFKGR